MSSAFVFGLIHNVLASKRFCDSPVLIFKSLSLQAYSFIVPHACTVKLKEVLHDSLYSLLQEFQSHFPKRKWWTLFFAFLGKEERLLTLACPSTKYAILPGGSLSEKDNKERLGMLSCPSTKYVALLAAKCSDPTLAVPGRRKTSVARRYLSPRKAIKSVPARSS
ncbi:hypothetical protein AVEN_117285-1 [Araneus ventricosus]|uniref:Uncharacterized protein n=1 Tax=Araneus ventricosus TaxID=182803 RepID=A0A4Y2KHI0_ARAVE|nr:hypothetical protein AVEN_117285-1 [Araneus ventricosus]